MRALIEFTRTHSDDDEYVYGKYGPYPGTEAFAKQLLAELADGGVHTEDAELVTETFRENSVGLDKDHYVLHIWLPVGDLKTREEVGSYLQQRGYDEGGAAGWFQVIALV